ncbi:hypothetical protein MTO96_037568 [Rhipicephalus appendiculatus]
MQRLKEKRSARRRQSTRLLEEARVALDDTDIGGLCSVIDRLQVNNEELLKLNAELEQSIPDEEFAAEINEVIKCIHLSCQPRLCPLRGSAVVLGLWHILHQHLTFMYALRKVAPQASGRGLPKRGESSPASCSPPAPPDYCELLQFRQVFVEMAPVQASAPQT